MHYNDLTAAQKYEKEQKYNSTIRINSFIKEHDLYILQKPNNYPVLLYGGDYYTNSNNNIYRISYLNGSIMSLSDMKV